LGNLSYKGTSQNFGAVMVRSSGISIVEVDEIVTPGEIGSHLINTPALFVDRIVKR
jgi:acyl CoA:acetate/3-ketoacid CoA transferase alpha subunit